MPIWARAIIFGIELVGFLILCIFATIKLYKEDYSKKHKAYALKNMKFNLLYFSINFAIILALFLFTFPSYAFLSYNKLICVTIFVLLSVTIIILALKNNTDTEIISFCYSILLIIEIAVFIVSILLLRVENEVAIYGEEIKTVLKPTMFSENQIGYTTRDMEGNIEKYCFYYIDNDVWTYKDINASEAKVIKIQNEDTHIVEKVTKTVYCKREKKTSENDYIFTEENTEYTIYLNLNQMVEIKID